jgi:membrane associated rhomboid family serine protease
LKDTLYTAQVRQRLLGQGFAELASPADIGFTLTLARKESWGRLLLAVAPIGIGDQPAAREALSSASGAWVLNMQRQGAEPCYMVLIFPFARRVPDALSGAVKALRREDPQQRWGVIPWTADLEVELVDRHTGFPRVDDGVARALTELERGAVAERWERLTGPRIGRGAALRIDMGHMPVTRLILAATISYYLWVAIAAGGLAALLGGPSAPALVTWGANDTRYVFGAGEQWRLFSHMLLHGGLLHLGLNMWALWNLGRHVEMVYGGGRMAFIYVVAGVLGGVASVAVRATTVTSVGASGAIMGLMGALVYFALALPGRRVDWRNLMGPVGINLMLGFFIPGIDNYAHIGGFIGGVLAAFLAGIPGERKPWRFAAMAAAGLVVLLLVGGVLPLPRLRL